MLKSKKFIYCAGTLVILIAKELVPALDEVNTMHIVALGLALITGHTVTDVSGIMKGGKKKK